VGFCFKRQPDRFENPVEFTIDFKVGEPENSVSRIPQRPVAHRVAAPMIVKAVLIAIDLDNKARSAALEIDDVICERRLPPEVMADCAKLSEFDPELHFLARHRFS
jgi:hypothetical protein